MAPDGSRYFLWPGKPLLIGREPDTQNRIVIYTDPLVSRQHARITVDKARTKVEDLNSFNGTIVNGQRIHEAWLYNGDTITVGRTELRFYLPPTIPVPRK